MLTDFNNFFNHFNIRLGRRGTENEIRQVAGEVWSTARGFEFVLTAQIYSVIAINSEFKLTIRVCNIL